MFKANNKNTRKRCEICPRTNYSGKNLWGEFHGRDFQVRGNCPEGNYLRAIVQGVVVLGDFHREQLSETVVQGKLFRGNCLRGKSPGGNCLGGFHRGQLSEGQFSRGNLFRGNCPGGISWGGSYPGRIS